MLLVLLGCPLYAAEKSAEAPPVRERTAAEQKKLDEMRKRVEQKQTELNGSRWELALSSLEPKAKSEKDVYTFQNGQFSSKNLSKRGFTATNYTVTVPSEGVESAVWETMQTGKEGVVFIRGEWEKEKMWGIVTEQLDEGKKIGHYSFSTTAHKAIPPTSEQEKKAADKGASTSTLVSKEAPVTSKKNPVISPFSPGTTEEAPTT